MNTNINGNRHFRLPSPSLPSLAKASSESASFGDRPRNINFESSFHQASPRSIKSVSNFPTRASHIGADKCGCFLDGEEMGGYHSHVPTRPRIQGMRHPMPYLDNHHASLVHEQLQYLRFMQQDCISAGSTLEPNINNAEGKRFGQADFDLDDYYSHACFSQRPTTFQISGEPNTNRGDVLNNLEERTKMIWRSHINLVEEMKERINSIVVKEQMLAQLQNQLDWAIVKSNKRQEEELGQIRVFLGVGLARVTKVHSELLDALKIAVGSDGYKLFGLLEEAKAAMLAITRKGAEDQAANQICKAFLQWQRETVAKQYSQQLEFSLDAKQRLDRALKDSQDAWNEYEQQMSRIDKYHHHLKEMDADKLRLLLELQSLRGKLDNIYGYVGGLEELAHVFFNDSILEVDRIKRAAVRVLSQMNTKKEEQSNRAMAKMLVSLENFVDNYGSGRKEGEMVANLVNKISTISTSVNSLLMQCDLEIRELRAMIFQFQSQIHRLEAENRYLREQVLEKEQYQVEIRQLREEVLKAEARYRDRDVMFQKELYAVVKEKTKLEQLMQGFDQGMIANELKDLDGKECIKENQMPVEANNIGDGTKEITPKAKRSRRLIVEEEEETIKVKDDAEPSGTKLCKLSKTDKAARGGNGYLIGFTGIRDKHQMEELESIVIRIGGKVHVGAEFPEQLTHIVTPIGHQSIKVMAASITSKWIMSPEWIYSSGKNGKFMDELEQGGLQWKNGFGGYSIENATGESGCTDRMQIGNAEVAYCRPFKGVKVYFSPLFIQQQNSQTKKVLFDAAMVGKTIVETLGKGKIVTDVFKADLVVLADDEEYSKDTQNAHGEKEDKKMIVKLDGFLDLIPICRHYKIRG